jgi:hypothetical protein
MIRQSGNRFAEKDHAAQGEARARSIQSEAILL